MQAPPLARAIREVFSIFSCRPVLSPTTLGDTGAVSSISGKHDEAALVDGGREKGL